MQPIKIDINRVRERTDNPRTISDDKLAGLIRSLESLPEMEKHRPIIIDEDGFILAGNMRYRALQKMGRETIWVVKANLPEELKKRLMIADNINVGEWDWDKLYSNWKDDELQEMGIDVWVEDDSAKDVPIEFQDS